MVFYSFYEFVMSYWILPIPLWGGEDRFYPHFENGLILMGVKSLAEA